jgi:hypothetical protein
MAPGAGMAVPLTTMLSMRFVPVVVLVPAVTTMNRMITLAWLSAALATDAKLEVVTGTDALQVTAFTV